ncbi:MAG: 1,4-dihydroxy-2-naphthoate octaprenyltransferase [Bacteroidales bacterium]|nr:1,4-dihydroxy-2-naphthoate octaprenyltransferase [Bacteroidales bacterium]
MQVKTNSLKAWILAARPKTLAGAVAPVLVGAALGFAVLLTYGRWRTGVIPFGLCVLFALAMQIDANFINDYFDFKKGADSTERLGPERACSQGWITPSAMKTGIIITTVISVLLGLPLIHYGGWWMLAVGLFCILGAFLYTTKFSYLGLGDIMVVVFFGIIPVLFTFYVISPGNLSVSPNELGNDVVEIGNSISWGMALLVCLAGACVGLVVNNLLIINNYRDRELDAKNEKKTLVVRLGAKASEWLYLLNGILATMGAMAIGGWMKRALTSGLEQAGWWTFPFQLVLPLLFLPFLFSAHRNMVRINHGRELNAVLGQTSRNILIYSLLFVLSVILAVLPVWCNR